MSRGTSEKVRGISERFRSLSIKHACIKWNFRHTQGDILIDGRRHKTYFP